MAFATDGKGHHDGSCEYEVDVPLADFGDLYVAGGEARWTEVNGGNPATVHKLPAAPAADTSLRFKLKVHPDGATGRRKLVGGLEVRASV